MELDRAPEAEAEQLLDRDVQEAELPELLCPAEWADVDRSLPAVGDELRDLLLRVVVVGGDQDVELLTVDVASKQRRRKGLVERLDDRSTLRDELGRPPRRRSYPAVRSACPTVSVSTGFVMSTTTLPPSPSGQRP